MEIEEEMKNDNESSGSKESNDENEEAEESSYTKKGFRNPDRLKRTRRTNNNKWK